jgi:hypothetical protein
MKADTSFSQKMKAGLSFRQRMEAGASLEELKKYYAMNDREYQRIIVSLQEIQKTGGKK